LTTFLGRRRPSMGSPGESGHPEVERVTPRGTGDLVRPVRRAGGGHHDRRSRTGGYATNSSSATPRITRYTAKMVIPCLPR
jgi:hypothetical protein